MHAIKIALIVKRERKPHIRLAFFKALLLVLLIEVPLLMTHVLLSV
jgi:hypothetical protein